MRFLYLNLKYHYNLILLVYLMVDIFLSNTSLKNLRGDRFLVIEKRDITNNYFTSTSSTQLNLMGVCLFTTLTCSHEFHFNMVPIN